MNVDPSSASLRASVRSLIPSFLATTFTTAWPWIENRRKLLRMLAGDDPFKRLLLVKGDAVEEAQGARDLIDA